MAEILARLKRHEGESPADFRDRCGLFVLFAQCPSNGDRGFITRSRVVMPPDGVARKPVLASEMAWGAAHGDAPLPSDECVVALIRGVDEIRLKYHEFDIEDYNRAPVNPRMFPRHPQRMSFVDFIKTARAVQREHGAKAFDVFFDGSRIGGADASSRLEALRIVHLAQVDSALHLCTASAPDELARGVVLPSPEALASHPDLTDADRHPEYADLVRVARMGVGVWPEEFILRAEQEGWILGKSDSGEIQVERLRSGPLSMDEDAWALVYEGRGLHHIQARTILSVASPMEFARLRDLSSRPVEVRQERPRMGEVG